MTQMSRQPGDILRVRYDANSFVRTTRLLASIFLVLLLFVGARSWAQMGKLEQGSYGLPISNGHIYMYAIGTKGYGGAPTSLLVDNGMNLVESDVSGMGYLTTDANGNFNLTGLYPNCDPNSMTYLVAIGGTPGNIPNANIVEISALPVTCSLLPQLTNVYINEATTVAAAFALGAIASPSSTGISMVGPTTQTLTDAIAFANSLVDSTTGRVLTTNSAYQTVNTISDILSACVTANQGNSCGSLQSLTEANGLWQTALAIALSPTSNVAGLYSLISAEAPYIPDTPQVPTTLTLAGHEFPIIQQVNALPAPANGQLQILGTGFGNSQSTNEVIVGGATGIVTNWQNGEIDVTLSPGAVSGYIEVYTGGYGSNIVAYTGPPIVSSFSTPEGPAGSTLVITGSGFGVFNGVCTISFNNVNATVQSWSENSIAVTIPNMNVGTYGVNATVTVTTSSNQSSVASAPNPFLVTPAPQLLTSVNHLIQGVLNVIAVTDVGPLQGSVAFNGVNQPIVSWTCTPDSPSSNPVCNIQFILEANYVSGSLTLKTVGGGFVLAPVSNVSIDAVATPLAGPNGSIITISANAYSGASPFPFGSQTGTVTYTPYGGSPTALQILSWQPSFVQCLITGFPVTSPGTSYGTITLKTAQNIELSSAPFFGITGLPTITSTSGGVVGATAEIIGTNFGNGPGTVYLNGALVVPSPPTSAGVSPTWAPTKITFPVAQNYLTGSVVVYVNGGVGTGAAITFPPEIVSTAPSTGSAGQIITLVGYNFNNLDRVGFFNCVGACGLSVLSSTYIDSQHLSITLPATLAKPPGYYPYFWIISDAMSNFGIVAPFTLIAPPFVASLSSPSGIVGTQLTILGSNFGNTAGTVSFNGFPVTTFSLPGESWASGQIVVDVPTGATTGNVQVITSSGAPSNTKPFTVVTGLGPLSPASGPSGTQVTMQVGGFSGTSISASLSGVPAQVQSWQPQTGMLVVIIPNINISAQPYTLTVFNSTQSATSSFTVTGPPTIGLVSPNFGPVGSQVTIQPVSGGTFGSGPGVVTFNGISVPQSGFIQPWGPASLTVQVPVGATTGSMSVSVQGGVSSTTTPTFTVTPYIQTLTPTAGPVGTPLMIHGTTFGTSCTATLGGVTLNVTPPNGSCADGLVTTTVPQSAQQGPQQVIVTTASGQSNASIFTVGSSPTISNVIPLKAAATNLITIYGGNFGGNNGTVNFTSGSNTITATPATWDGNNGVITVAVPNGLAVGSVTIVVVDNGGNLLSSGYQYTIAPGITSLSFPQGPPTMGLQINGTGFGTVAGVVQVTLSNFGNPIQMILIGSPSDSLLTVQVPSTATTSLPSGPVAPETITVTIDGIDSLPVSFQVVAPFGCPL